MKSDSENGNDSNGLNLIHGLTLFLIVIGGIAVSIIFLLHSRENYEEVYNIHAASLHTAASSLGSDDDPMPLYFLLQRVWLHDVAVHLTFMSQLVAARVLSLFFYPLTVVAAYFAGLAATKDRRIGMAAAMFVGLSPFMLWYSSRATVYSLLVFTVLINQYFFTKLLEHPKWWHWVGYFLTGLLGIGAHYFFSVILLVQLVFYVARTKRKLDTLWLVLSVLFIGLAFGLWVLYSGDHTNFWHYLPYTSRPSATNTFIVFVEYVFGFQSVTTTTLIIAFWPLLVVVALLAIQKYIAPPPAIQYSFWAAAAPVLGMFILAWVWKPLFLSSYLIIGMAPLMLLLGWYFVALKLRTLYWACYALMALMATMFIIEATDPSWALQNDYLGAISSITRTNAQ